MKKTRSKKSRDTVPLMRMSTNMYIFLNWLLRLRYMSEVDQHYNFVDFDVTKRCRLSWLTNGALVYEPKCGERGELRVSANVSTAEYRSPNKCWRSNSIFNLWLHRNNQRPHRCWIPSRCCCWHPCSHWHHRGFWCPLLLLALLLLQMLCCCRQ
jgi:hypothetical protein